MVRQHSVRWQRECSAVVNRNKLYILRIRSPKAKLVKHAREVREDKYSMPPLVICVMLAVNRKETFVNYREANTGRGHCVRGRLLKNTWNGIIFEGEDLSIMTFTELLYSVFDQRVRPFLDGEDAAGIATIDDACDYYLRKLGER